MSLKQAELPSETNCSVATVETLVLLLFVIALRLSGSAHPQTHFTPAAVPPPTCLQRRRSPLLQALESHSGKYGLLPTQAKVDSVGCGGKPPPPPIPHTYTLSLSHTHTRAKNKKALTSKVRVTIQTDFDVKQQDVRVDVCLSPLCSIKQAAAPPEIPSTC